MIPFGELTPPWARPTLQGLLAFDLQFIRADATDPHTWETFSRN
jgi:hypothetical protein